MTPLDIPRSFSPWRHWRRFCSLLVALFVLRGVFVLCVLPPLEGWDEYQHVAYIVHLEERGEPPRFGEAFVSKRLLEAAVAFPQCRTACEQEPRYGAIPYDEFWSRPDPPGPVQPLPDLALYQTQHAPVYYRLAAPIFRAAGGVANLGPSVFALRLVNLALGALALVIALWGIRRWIRHPVAAALIGLGVALHPLYLLNTLRVSNDALALALGTWVVVWCLELAGRRLWRHALALGLVLGLAVVAKTVNLVLVPFALACLLAVAWRGQAHWGRVALAGVLLMAGAATASHGYFWHNWMNYGTATTMQEAILNQQAGRGLDTLFEVIWRVDWGERLRRLWIEDQVWVGGWSYLGPPKALVHGYSWVLGVAAVGPLAAWIWPRRRPASALTRDPYLAAKLLALCLLFTAAIFYHQAQYAMRWDGRLPSNPWYAASAFPAFLALVSLVGLAWPVAGWRFVVPLAIAGLLGWIEVASVFQQMVPAYAGLPAGDEAFERLARLRPSWLDRTTMTVALAGATAVLGLALLAVAVGRHRPPRGRPDHPEKSAEETGRFTAAD